MKAASFFCGNDMIVFIDGEIINELQGIYFIEDLKTADKPVKGYVTVVECKDEKSIREKLLNANEIRVEYVRRTNKYGYIKRELIKGVQFHAVEKSRNVKDAAFTTKYQFVADTVNIEEEKILIP